MTKKEKTEKFEGLIKEALFMGLLGIWTLIITLMIKHMEYLPTTFFEGLGSLMIFGCLLMLLLIQIKKRI